MNDEHVSGAHGATGAGQTSPSGPERADHPASDGLPDALLGLDEAMRAGRIGGDWARQRPAVPGGRRSVVLVLFVGDAIVFVQRATTVRKHAGQVAFPGGALDEGENAREAALRETCEETGLDPSCIRILGELPPASIPASGFAVVPVVGWWMGGEVALQGWDPAEIAGVQVVPLARLVDPDHRFTAVNARGFRTPGFDVPPLWIWGFTAFVLDAVLRAGGWEQPWDATRERPVPDALGGRAPR